MVKKSLLENSIFNIVRTLSGVLFPIITFSYATRILGVVGIGRVNFAKSFISYFTMIAMLGMNYYGTREAAKLRDDKEALSKFCMEMLCINACTTLLAYGLLAVAMIFVPSLRGYETLLLISSAAILLQGMGMEWLYQAMEEYRYIAIRSVLFQIVALMMMFIFVRDRNDVVLYAVVVLISSSGSYILNFINARKYIRFHHLPTYEFKKHLKPLLWLFSMAISVEMYIVLDSTMLGFLKGDAAVGLYTAAIKVERIVNTVIFAFCIVLIPRLSYYISRKEYTKTKDLVLKAYNYVFMLSVPAAIGLFMLSDEIIMLLSGSEFSSAGITMRILTPIVVLIPFSMVTNRQILIPMGKDKLTLISTATGAVVDFTLNMLLIPLYAENGAAVATVLAETAVAIVCLIVGSKQFNIKLIFSTYYHYWLAAAVIPVVVLLIKLIKAPYIIHLIVAIPTSAMLFLSILLLLKNQYAKEAVLLVKKKLLFGKEQKNG